MHRPWPKFTSRHIYGKHASKLNSISENLTWLALLICFLSPANAISASYRFTNFLFKTSNYSADVCCVCGAGNFSYVFLSWAAKEQDFHNWWASVPITQSHNQVSVIILFTTLNRDTNWTSNEIKPTFQLLSFFLLSFNYIDKCGN